MNAMLATGGLDDVAMAVGEDMFIGVIIIAGCIAVFSWWKHSLVAAVIAFLLILADGAFFQPWTAISADDYDAYDIYWLFSVRVISVVWLVLFAAATICLMRTIRYQRQKRFGAK